MTHDITENIFPFPPDLGQHQTSPGTEKTEALPLKVSNFSLAFYRSEPYVARAFLSQLPVHCYLCVFRQQHVSHQREG